VLSVTCLIVPNGVVRCLFGALAERRLRLSSGIRLVDLDAEADVATTGVAGGVSDGGGDWSVMFC
jgi:hypothetical protein